MNQFHTELELLTRLCRELNEAIDLNHDVDIEQLEEEYQDHFSDLVKKYGNPAFAIEAIDEPLTEQELNELRLHFEETIEMHTGKAVILTIRP